MCNGMLQTEILRTSTTCESARYFSACCTTRIIYWWSCHVLFCCTRNKKPNDNKTVEVDEQLKWLILTGRKGIKCLLLEGNTKKTVTCCFLSVFTLTTADIFRNIIDVLNHLVLLTSEDNLIWLWINYLWCSQNLNLNIFHFTFTISDIGAFVPSSSLVVFTKNGFIFSLMLLI